MVFKNRRAQTGLVFHSDRGVQYCAKSFRGLLRERCPSVQQGMSRKGNCWDNAWAESFFKTLKRELETLDGKHTAADVRQKIFLYIEAYYYRVRLHSSLDYLEGQKSKCCCPGGHLLPLHRAEGDAFYKASRPE
jgi:transposase InsO family protein